MWEGWTSLDQMIGEQSKRVILGKDRGLIVERAILEMEHDFTRDLVILNCLNQVTRSEDLAVKRTEHKKSVRYTLAVADSHRVGEYATDKAENADKQT